MSALVRTTPSATAHAGPPRRAVSLALIGAIIAALATLFWQRSSNAIVDPRALPLYGSMAVMTMLCAAALAAVEFRRRFTATLCVLPVLIVVAATIISWVLGFSTLFGFSLFGQPDAPVAWFPPRIAIELAIPAALMSLAVFLLTLEDLNPIAGPFAWATGVLFVGVPPVRCATQALSAHYATNQEMQVEILLSVALMFLGLALIVSRGVRTSAVDKLLVGDRSARARALLVVAAIAATVGLWYAVRATEIRQLTSDVDFALEETARALQGGIAENTNSTDRLWQHWRALDWKVSDELFLSDVRIFMRRQVASSAVAMLDRRGAVLKMARRAGPLGAPQSSDDVIDLAEAHTVEPLLDDATRLTLLRTATMKRERTRGEPLMLSQGVVLTPTLVPLFDESGALLGAFWMLYRADVVVDRILRETAPDFNLHVTIGKRVVYDRAPRDGAYARGQRFTRIDQRDFNNNIYTIEVSPSEKIVTRALGWTPLLVLLFGWASLILLLLALYNERRVHMLYRDRERILNQSLDLICTMRDDGTIVTANDAAQRVLGLPSAALPGRSLLDFVPAAQRERVHQDWLTHASETQTSPAPFVHVAGRTIYLQAVLRWSPEERLLYCAMRDVTSEYELHTQRQHAEATFRIGVAQAGCAVYEYQAPQHETEPARIEWVGAIRALTGYEAEELAAGGFDGWMQLVHPDDAQHVRQILERCIETRQPHTVDYRLRRKDGSYVPVLDRGRHLTEASHRAPRMIGALIDLTAIRQQENALRRSEERYRIIASQVGAVIIERDTASGRIRAFGPVEHIFGYTREQLESRPLTREDTMIHPDDRPHYFAAVDAAERSLSSYYVEHRRRHRGGHYIYIAARGIVLPGLDGRAEREIIAITDITDRKRAELALQESEERFRLAVEQSGQIVYEFAFDQDSRTVSRRFAGGIEAMLGFTPTELHEIYATKDFALVHPDDLPIVRNLAAIADEHGTFQVEHRMRHKDGHYVSVESRGSLRRNERGEVVGILGLLLDISAAKSAEIDRQHYTAQLRALADIAHKVGSFLSLHELLKYLAASMRSLLGTNAASALVVDAVLAPETIVAASYAEHYGVQRGNASALGAPELQRQVRSENRPQRYTTAQIAADAELQRLTLHDELRHPLRGWLGAPLIARDGANLGLLEVSDKGDGEFSETDLQVLNQLAGLASVAIENIRVYATLEDRVTARTQELEISNRELEAFSYSVSHDLRAPLRAIAGFSTILETEYATKMDDSARRYLQRITAGVERMANLIDDLLSLARVSRAELRRESVDLTAMTKAVLKRQTERIEQRAVEIVIDPKMKVVADPRLVEVALENLIENALKFTGTRPHARVHIGQRRVDGRPVFYVADNGVGFDTKYASNLFGVFQRLHSASDFPGTGVGLATVQRIIQRHQGRIWAEADVDRGATFYFTLTSEA